MVRRLVLISALMCCTLLSSAQTVRSGASEFNIQGVVKDAATNEPLGFATIQMVDAKGDFITGTTTTERGEFTLKSVSPYFRLVVSYLGYETLRYENLWTKNQFIDLALKEDKMMLNEVVVTAVESKNSMTSSSKIDRTAMQHLQPSSFADILALLPGGSTSTPQMTSANVIKLREAGTSNSDYAVSSLGTAFIVDGQVLNNDANLQRVDQGGSTQDGSRNHTNYGVDMRSISTDNVEEVEVVRGVPSAEYGDLTSGAVIIKRRLTATPWSARFKADQYGQLFFVGKGVEFKEQKLVLNVDVDYLNSKADPRNLMENYKRVNGSFRLGKKWIANGYNIELRNSVDARFSLDNEKNDPNITTMTEDRYKKSNQQYSTNNKLKVTFPKHYFVKAVEVSASAAMSFDQIVQSKFIQLDRDRVTPNYMEAGEQDGVYLPYKYVANVTVDGKPLNVGVNALVIGRGEKGCLNHTFKGGLNYKYDKNFGQGQVYDLSRPLNTVNSTRPRAYSDIPGLSELALFAEEQLRFKFAAHRLNVIAGLRATTLLNLDERFALSGKVFLDPRLNVQWFLPAIQIGNNPLSVDVSGSLGRLTKKPTLSYLYPNNYYIDLVQLSYYHSNDEYKRINLQTYIIDPTNYDLNVARNNKWEVRLGMNYNRNSLSVTYFRETMNSGFRYSTIAQPFSYKRYDASTIVGSELQGPPSLENLSYVNDTVLSTYSMATNGTRINKEGIEFQMSTQRVEVLKTRLTIYGAWFKTLYSNSEQQYDASVTKIIHNVPVNDKYIGLYNWNDGSVVESFNTNFLFDTYLKNIGLTFSTSFECHWSQSRRTLRKNGVPIAYINTKGEVLPFTEEDAKDPYKQWLIRDYTDSQFAKTVEPFYMYVNLKCTKDFGQHFRVALFVDRIFDVMPSYKNNMGTLVRRSSRPYFGMEMTLKL